MKPAVNNARKLGMWKTYDRISQGKYILWEFIYNDNIDLLLYEKDTPIIEIELDIENYYGERFIDMACSLCPLLPEYVYKNYIKD